MAHFPSRLINVPAALGLLASLCALALPRSRTFGWWLVGVFGVMTAAFVALALEYGFADQFYARNIPALINLPLSIAALAALQWPKLAKRLLLTHGGKALVVLAVLACGSLTIQTASAREWGTYVTALREILWSRTGLIAWEDLMQELPRDQARLLKKMNFPFANPDMSLLLARDRRVQSIVMNPRTTKWAGWRPTSASEWPKGWDYAGLSPATEGRSTP